MTMETIFDFMEPFENFLIILNRYGIGTADVKYFAAYREYLRQRATGATYYACVETVSERFGIVVGTLRTKIKLFSKRLEK